MVRLQENTHFIYDKNELMGLSDESNYNRKWGQVMNLTPLKNTVLNINSKNGKNGKIYLINKEISLGSSPDPISVKQLSILLKLIY